MVLILWTCASSIVEAGLHDSLVNTFEGKRLHQVVYFFISFIKSIY